MWAMVGLIGIGALALFIAHCLRAFDRAIRRDIDRLLSD